MRKHIKQVASCKLRRLIAFRHGTGLLWRPSCAGGGCQPNVIGESYAAVATHVAGAMGRYRVDR